MVAELVPMTAKQVVDLDIPPREWHVERLIPVGSISLLSAREKSGKGLFCIDLAASIAEGKPFAGLETIQGNATYLASEESEEELQERIFRRCGVNPPTAFNVVNLNGSDNEMIDLARVEDAARIDRYVERYSVDFLILDVLRELHSAQEDSSTEMKAIMRPLRNIAHNRRCTIVVTHHNNKSGGFRGSTSIASGVDASLLMKTDLDSPNLKGTITGNGRAFRKVEVGIEFGDDGRWTGTLNNPVHSFKKPAAAEQILSTLMQADWPMDVNTLEEELPLSRSTIANTMTKLYQSYPDFIVRTSGKGPGTPSQYEVRRDHIPDCFAHLSI